MFVTTSTFTRDAIDDAEQIDTKIVLVDEHTLARLMILHDVGCSPVQTFVEKKLDSDYFVEQYDDACGSDCRLTPGSVRLHTVSQVRGSDRPRLSILPPAESTPLSTIAFDRDSMAHWYATQHLEVDQGIEEVVDLPTNAGERDIRLLEINKEMLDADDHLEPINYGVDMGTGNEHVLWVIDVTPDQYERIRNNSLLLPGTWNIDASVVFRRDSKRGRQR